MRFLLLFSFIFIYFAHSFYLKKADNEDVLPNINTFFCNNPALSKVVFSAFKNFSNSKGTAVDQLQAAIETSLMSTFESSGGTWLVSVTSYHRVNGYVDERATNMETFCAVNDVNLNLYVVIMKIDSS